MAGADKFAKLTFEDFRRLAQDPALSRFERIGFPDSYREGHEADIFADILRKVTRLDQNRKTVVDIGPGCSDLPRMLIEHCQRQAHQLYLVDSQEMLAHLPTEPFIRKIAAL